MVRQAAKKYQSKEIVESIETLWKERDAYRLTKEHHSKGEDFYFIDGPPYTSGSIHLGTAWNKILKDAVIRKHRMEGFNVRDQPGFDMHGLPIEVLVEKTLGIKNKRQIEIMGVSKFISRCKDFALKHHTTMTGQFKQLGVWLDWDNPYMTIKDEYITAAWWTIKRAEEQNLLSKDLRVLSWCSRCETALAEAELEYKSIKDYSIYIKFPTRRSANEYIVVWTTTPWTLTGNLAVAIHPEYNYVRVLANNKGVEEYYIILEDTHQQVMEEVGITDYMVVETMPGLGLSGIAYSTPLGKEIDWPDFPGIEEWLHKIILFEGVEANQTGVVHIAPGYGPEDFEIGKEHSLPPFCPVTSEGKLATNTGKYSNMEVREASKTVIEDLKRKDLLLHRTEEEHRYGHCWRCRSPIIYRVTNQWFLKTGDIKETMLKEVDRVKWTPEWAGASRQKNWLENSRDWCISRQRYWGIPLPVWECECGSRFVASSKDDLKEEVGYKEDMELHRPWVDRIKVNCRECGKMMDRVPDVLDVWFDSAVCSWAQLGYPANEEEFNRWWPCRWIAEGHDQTRGWFYSQMAAGVIAFGRAPYDSVLTHGFTLDKNGKPMSKSLGNVVDPLSVIEKYGLDELRLYILGSSAPWDDLTYSEDGVKNFQRMLNILWNTYYFATTYMALDGFDPSAKKTTIEKLKNKLEVEDLWIISRLESTKREVDVEWNGYNLHKAIRAIERFIMDDFSRWYIRLVKDRAWIEDPQDTNKLCMHATMGYVLNSVALLLAPFAPYISEEIYQNLDGRFASIHMASWPEQQSMWVNPTLEKQMAAAEKIVEATANARQKAGKKIRWPLKRIILKGEPDLLAVAGNLERIILSQTNIKNIEFLSHDKEWEEMDIRVQPNLDAIGPVFRQWASRIAILLQAQDPKHIMEKMKQGEYVLGIEGQIVKITPEMLNFTANLPPDVYETHFDDGMLYLDARMNDSLMGEAYCREIIRRVQQMRKEMDLEVEDVIETTLVLDEDMLILLEEWGEHIAEQTRSQLLQFASEPPDDSYAIEWNIDGKKAIIGIVALVFEEPEPEPKPEEVDSGGTLQEFLQEEMEKGTEAIGHPGKVPASAPTSVSAGAKVAEKVNGATPEPKEPAVETSEPAHSEPVQTGVAKLPPCDDEEKETASLLAQIKGLGDKKVKTLMKAGFDTRLAIIEADVAAMAKTKGITKKLAKKIIAEIKDMAYAQEETTFVGCPVCGSPVGDNDTKCPRCGTALIDPDKPIDEKKKPMNIPILKPGNVYLVPSKEGEKDRVFAILKKALGEEGRGLCFTKDHPEKLKKKHGLDKCTLVWLSESGKKGAVEPQNLERINLTVETFLKSGSGIIVMDGIEQMLSSTNLKSILRLVQTIREQTTLTSSTTIIPLDKEVVGDDAFNKIREETDAVI